MDHPRNRQQPPAVSTGGARKGSAAEMRISLTEQHR